VGHVEGLRAYLWREWLTSVDHKRIGVMYIVLGMLAPLRGFRCDHDASAAGDRGWRRAGHSPPEFRPISRRTAPS
jgi:hypothetical protein